MKTQLIQDLAESNSAAPQLPPLARPPAAPPPPIPVQAAPPVRAMGAGVWQPRPSVPADSVAPAATGTPLAEGEVDPDSIDFAAVFLAGARRQHAPLNARQAEPQNARHGAPQNLQKATPPQQTSAPELPQESRDAGASLVARAGSSVPPGARMLRATDSPIPIDPPSFFFGDAPLQESSEPHPMPTFAMPPAESQEPAASMFDLQPENADSQPLSEPLQQLELPAKPAAAAEAPVWFADPESADWPQRQRRTGRRIWMPLAATALLTLAGGWGYAEYVQADKPLVAWEGVPAAPVAAAAIAAPASAGPPPMVLAEPPREPAPVAETPIEPTVKAETPPEPQSAVVARAQPDAPKAPKPARSQPVERKRAARPVAKPKATAVAASGAVPLTGKQELLRQCRAIGYHAEKCFARSCTVTKFGLACRGGTGRR